MAMWSTTHIKSSRRLRLEKVMKKKRKKRKRGREAELPFILYFIFGLRLGNKWSEDVKNVPLIQLKEKRGKTEQSGVPVNDIPSKCL